MHRFRVLGMTDAAGHCELCGTYCPARRVAVELVDVDGAATGDVQYWGVVCAAEARSGRRDSTIARQLRQEAEEAGAYAADRPHAGRRPGRPAAPRQLSRRAAAQLAAARAADDRIVWARAGATIDQAETNYRHTGRPMAGSYLAADAAGRVARVDATDSADVARFTAAGFTTTQEPAAA
jgi:hypothetical protein